MSYVYVIVLWVGGPEMCKVVTTEDGYVHLFDSFVEAYQYAKKELQYPWSIVRLEEDDG